MPPPSSTTFKITNKMSSFELKLPTNQTYPLISHFNVNSAFSLADPTNRTFFCKDSRAKSLNFGAPGGDFGEFLLALSILPQSILSQDFIKSTFNLFIDKFCSSTRPFYLHTDHNSLFKAGLTDLESIKSGCGLEKYRNALLSNPTIHGCGHLRLIASDPDRYEISVTLLNSLVQVFFDRLHDDINQTDSKCLLKVYDDECLGEGLIIVDSTERINEGSQANKYDRKESTQNQTLSILTQQSIILDESNTPKQMFILSQAALKSFRQLVIAPFFISQIGKSLPNSLSSNELFELLEAKGRRNAMYSAESLASGKPIYTVTFEEQINKPTNKVS